MFSIQMDRQPSGAVLLVHNRHTWTHTGDMVSCVEPINVLCRLFSEVTGDADSNWAEAGRRIFEGQGELAIL